MPVKDISPMVVIKQKEIELERRLAEARAAAARTISDARQWASAYRSQAEKDAQEVAEAYYLAELESVDAEADRLRLEGEQIASRIAERGARVLDQAVERVLEIILPHPGEV